MWTEKNSARWIRNAFPFFRLLPPHECMCDKFYWFSTRFRPTLTLQGLSKSSWAPPRGGPKWAKYGKHVTNSYKFLENTALGGRIQRYKKDTGLPRAAPCGKMALDRDFGHFWANGQLPTPHPVCLSIICAKRGEMGKCPTGDFSATIARLNM